MTAKKQSILQTALELFARDGYKSTATSKIAQLAEVSESLIFKHFKTKEGLLHAIIENGVEHSKLLLAGVVLEPDPKVLIRKFIELPFDLPEPDKNYWKLIYKIKWEIEYNHSQSMEPVQRALVNAFKELNYQNPELESEFLMQFMDGITGNILRGSTVFDKSLKEFLLNKYELI